MERGGGGVQEDLQHLTFLRFLGLCFSISK